MSYKVKWHRFPNDPPTNDGQYIICDSNKNMQVCFFMKEVPRTYRVYAGPNVEGELLTNVFLWSRSANVGRNPQVRKNVCFWTDIPELPIEITGPLEEIKRLEERIKELQEQIKQYEQEC